MIAYRNQWLDLLDWNRIRPWFWATLIAIVFLPIGMIALGALEGKNNDFTGGVNTLAFFYAMWEPFVFIGMCMSLLAWFRSRSSGSSQFAQLLSRSAYTVYIIHPLVLVGISSLFAGFALPHGLSFLIVGGLAIVFCFLFAMLIIKIPFVNNIL